MRFSCFPISVLSSSRPEQTSPIAKSSTAGQDRLWRPQGREKLRRPSPTGSRNHELRKHKKEGKVGSTKKNGFENGPRSHSESSFRAFQIPCFRVPVRSRPRQSRSRLPPAKTVFSDRRGGRSCGAHRLRGHEITKFESTKKRGKLGPRGRKDLRIGLPHDSWALGDY